LEEKEEKVNRHPQICRTPVETLPLNGRRFLDLAFLTPAVSQEAERGQISFAGQRGINSNI
jgi:hypothetical protein